MNRKSPASVVISALFSVLLLYQDQVVVEMEVYLITDHLLDFKFWSRTED